MACIYLVDYENVNLNGLNGINELDKKDLVYIYCRENDVNRIRNYLIERKIKTNVICKIVNGISRNALDFELISDMFMNLKKDGMKIIISHDKGFDAAINRGMCSGFLCFRQNFIGEKGFETSFSYYGEKLKEYEIK